MEQRGEGTSPTPDGSPACQMDRSAASEAGQGGGSEHPHISAGGKDWLGLPWGWGSPETPGPMGEASGSTVPPSLVWCPQDEQRAHSRAFRAEVPAGQAGGTGTGAACMGRGPHCTCRRDFGLCAHSSGPEGGC